MPAIARVVQMIGVLKSREFSKYFLSIPALPEASSLLDSKLLKIFSSFP
jgi:hypothetical protein